LSRIPAEALPTIFEPFVQADSTIKRRHGGSGLGASFAKELTRLMGGEISVTSELGVGTRFELTFELKKPPVPNQITYIYPLTIVVLSAVPPRDTLGAILRAFRVQVVHASSLIELSQRVQELLPEAKPHGVMVNADDFGNMLPRALGVVGTSSARRPIPVVAFGDIAFRASAVSAGYCSYFSNISEATLAGVFSTISTLSTPNRKTVDGAVKATPIVPLRILAADDDATNRKLIERVLRQAGHQCKVVADGEEALFELHDHRYDLAILDMHMPKRDGIEVAKIYRFARFDSASTIPIILLTADSSIHAEQEAASAGVNRFLTKPIKPADLIEAISSTYAEAEFRAKPAADAGPFEAQAPTNVASLRSYRTEFQTPSEDECVSTALLSDLLSFMTKDEQTEFCAEFCIDAENYVRSIESARTNDEIVKAQYNDMHSLAGAAITIGAAQLANLAKKIENLSEQDIRENRYNLLRELRMQCDATVRHIKENYLSLHH
jgi:CheY-like chemotaxis protein/HPt (histidine-containing phosphotransfer) domain-containing protein